MYSGLSAPQTDEEVAQLSARIMTGVEGGLFHAKRGCLIGVKCTDTHIVPVVVHHGCDVEPSNLDLHVERWVETEPGPRSGLQQLDSLGNCIRRYPYNAARAQPLHWTIYGPQTGIEREQPVPRNERFDQLRSLDSERSVRGNILVVKTEPSGLVVDVLERDLLFIERLVYSFVEDTATRSLYPIHTDNPLVESPAMGWRGTAWGFTDNGWG